MGGKTRHIFRENSHFYRIPKRWKNRIFFFVLLDLQGVSRANLSGFPTTHRYSGRYPMYRLNPLVICTLAKFRFKLGCFCALNQTWIGLQCTCEENVIIASKYNPVVV